MMGGEEICGAFGPVERGQILRCTRLQQGHRGPHRHRRDYIDRKWQYEYALEKDDKGRILGSYRQRGYALPGPTPRGDERQKPLWGPGSNLQPALKDLNQLDDAEPEIPAQPNAKIPEIPLCDQVDVLTEDHCRAWWPRGRDGLDHDIAHVCHKTEDHPHEGRCECVCGVRRKAKSYGPLDATDRPEEELEAYG